MFTKHYKPVQQKVWTGRIDSTDNYDAFRWHQWIQPLDLKKDNPVFDGKLGIAFIGFCCDKGVQVNKGRPGASKGPFSIRKELTNLPCCFDAALKLFDAGNIIIESNTLKEAQDELAYAVEKILALNLFPIVLGGGHEIAFGHYKGLFNHIQQSKADPHIGIINFDAHFDIRPYPDGSSSGTMFRQIADHHMENGFSYNYFALGIQKRGNTVDLFKTANSLGIEHILAKDILDSDLWSIIEKLDRFIQKNDHIYMTICADVFSSGFAPGVSAAQPLGLEPEKVIKLLKYIIKSNKVISFDIAEVSPRFDQDYITARLASTLIFAVVNTLAELHQLTL